MKLRVPLRLRRCVLLGIAPLAAQTQSSRSAAELMDAVMWNREPIGGPFALIDHNGKPRTNEEFRGKLMLVYFGFTYCPDVCPTDLQNIGLALDQLGPAGEQIQPLFITVDPERDTAEHLKDYVPMFHPRLIGLTGDAAAIHAAAAAYRAYYAQGPAQGRRLHRRPLIVHLYCGSGRPVSRLLPARHAAGTHRRVAPAAPQALDQSRHRLHVARCPGTRSRQAPDR